MNSEFLDKHPYTPAGLVRISHLDPPRRQQLDAARRAKLSRPKGVGEQRWCLATASKSGALPEAGRPF